MKCRAMTRIMQFCMVLVVMVSVFFCAPMDVSAEEYVVDDIDSSISSTPINSSGYYGSSKAVSYTTPLNVDSFNESSLYKVTLSAKSQINLYTNSNATTRNTNSVSIRYNFLKFGNHLLTTIIATTATSGFNRSFTDLVFYATGSELLNENIYHYYMLTDTTSVTSLYHKGNLEITNCVIEALSVADADQYQQGYDAGYADGVVAGEDSGYSSGYNDGFSDGQASVDTDSYYDSGYQAGESAGYESGYQAGESAGYESGFQAGVDSVDTQSYYDAGYQAGYDIAYQVGYDTGYEEAYDIAYESGYNSAMDRIANWGADTSDYPLLIQQTDGTFDLQFDFIQPARVDDVISAYCDIGRHYSGIVFNPNHTYRLDFTYHDFEYDYSDSYFTASYSFWLYWGSCSFPISVGSKDDITSSFYISGDRIGTGLEFRCDVSGLEAYSEYFGVLHYYINDCTLKLYDMGPSGDTQNHIANQTDQLTNGYDSSQGAAVNDDFKASVNEYHTAEDSLFSTATTSLENFTFLDFTSITGMVTSLSFVTSIMTSIYMAMGGDTGASGIILAVLFSVMLVSMAIGLYRYYVSNGKSDGSGKGGD